MTMRFLCGVLLVASNCWQSAKAAEDAELQGQFAASGLPGLCVAAVDARGQRFAAAYGFADMRHRVPYTTDTVQPVGSVSKTVIGLALAHAVVEQNLDLDAPIDIELSFVVRNPAYPAVPLTWRQLATHTMTKRLTQKHM
jgi:CubicO group peptidase (beta-lactamase class C family)